MDHRPASSASEESPLLGCVIMNLFHPVIIKRVICSDIIPYMADNIPKLKDRLHIFQNIDNVGKPDQASAKLLAYLNSLDHSGKWSIFVEALKQAKYESLYNCLIYPEDYSINPDDKDFQHLTVFINHIIDGITFKDNTLLKFLLEKNIITTDEEERIQNCLQNNNDMDAILELFHVIHRKSPHWYTIFLESLCENNYIELVKDIDLNYYDNRQEQLKKNGKFNWTGISCIKGSPNKDMSKWKSDKKWLEKAIDIVKLAVEEDTNRYYEEALRLYKLSLNYFVYAMKYEKHSQKAIESIKAKSEQYITRAEIIDKFLKKKCPYWTDVDDVSNTTETSAAAKYAVSEPKVEWKDVFGLDSVKETLKEMFLLPLKFPHLFTGNRMPHHSVMLFGPPGTGKSYLAKAVATEANNSPFFSVSSSDLVSKYLGESGDSVKTIFKLAREKTPSVLFIDDIDILFSLNDEEQSTGIQVIKRVFLEQLDDIKGNYGILFLTVSSKPWTLPPKVRRKFVKRIYIHLLEAEARTSLIKHEIGNISHCLTEENFHEVGIKTEGYSSADICVLVKDALMQPLRCIQAATHFRRVIGPSRSDPSVIVHDLLTPCSPGAPGAMEMTWTQVDGDKLLEPIVSMTDMLRALQKVKPSITAEELARHQKFQEEFADD